MSSLYGTNQAYQALSDTYLALSLDENGDKIFPTNIKYNDLVEWGIYDGQERDPFVVNEYMRQQQNCIGSLCKEEEKTMSDYSLSTTVWNTMMNMSEISKFVALCHRSGWNRYLNDPNSLSKVTIFAPINQAIPDTWIEKMNVMNGNSIRPFMSAHTLPFAFKIEQAKGRKLRLYTSLNTYSIYVDGTGEVEEGVNIYVPKTTFNTLSYPTPFERIHILKVIYTQNGTIVIIDGICKPQVIV